MSAGSRSSQASFHAAAWRSRQTLLAARTQFLTPTLATAWRIPPHDESEESRETTHRNHHNVAKSVPGSEPQPESMVSGEGSTLLIEPCECHRRCAKSAVARLYPGSATGESPVTPDPRILTGTLSNNP